MQRENLRYAILESRVEPSFWSRLVEVKLDIDKLDESPRIIWGTYESSSSLMSVDCSSFNRDFSGPPTASAAQGCLINTNTTEGFDRIDKNQLLRRYGEEMLHNIESGRALSNPSLLAKFIVVSYANLKRYIFRFWFGFPTPSSQFARLSMPILPLAGYFSSELKEQLLQIYRSLQDWKQRNAFLIIVSGGEVRFVPLDRIEETFPQWSVTVDGYYLVVVDPCNHQQGVSCIVKNFLLMVGVLFPQHSDIAIQVICLRVQADTAGVPTLDKSLVLKVELDQEQVDKFALRWTGWESDEDGKLRPRKTMLAELMNPKRLADAAVHMNLKLMKWRLVPNLDLEIIKSTKCLLFGGGTLGCAVARILLGWGVRKITIVDSARVSYSNPVRQSLYEHEDCFNSGRLKATTAAEHLTRISPGVDATGIYLTIPMPGHSGMVEVERDVATMESLFDEHDVAFLLTDSRESRWLPTLLGVAKQKLTICAALGFDTFLVMRHGVPTEDEESIQPNDELGCYYCTDVIAPRNSQTDRTLDMQCTVTRPGLSAIASGIAVELMVSVLQHPNKARAPAMASEEGLLGCVPHTVRGNLSEFSLMTPTTPRFTNCIACSQMVVEEYKNNGTSFIKQVIDNPDYLKEVSGLAALCSEIETVQVLDLSASSSSEELEVLIDDDFLSTGDVQ